MWKAINEVINKGAIARKVAFQHSELSDIEVANTFNSHFIDAGALSQNDTPVSCTEYILNRCSSTVFLAPTEQHEIQTIILSLKDSCASGEDDIKVKPLKAVSEIVSTPLAHICNLILSNGVFPDKMKLARVTVIHKSGPVNDMNNYRPISVLSVFAKIAEHVINRRLCEFLNTYKIIAQEQYGFCKAKSSETALLEIKEQILDNIENRMLTLGIFLDFRKAFDCVQHDVLLKKLPLYGIRGVALSLIKSYLTSRTQYTTINGVSSEIQYIKYGVPQGSVLGPVLFLLYINDIVNIQGCSNIILYADDTNVFFSGREIGNLFEQANIWLQQLSLWLNANKLQLNITKTKYLVFKSKGTIIHPHLTLQFQKVNLEQAPTARFLGITFHENMSWSPHVDVLRKILLVLSVC